MRRYWFPLNIEQFTTDTRGLTAAQVGSFIRLLCHQWERGSVPSAAAVRARIAGVNRAAWNLIEPALSPLFTVETTTGNWIHQGLTRETLRAEEISSKRKAAGSSNARTTTTTQSVGREEKNKSPNLVVLDSTGAQRRERPSGEAVPSLGLSNQDGSVSFTALEIAGLCEKYHLVKADGMVRQLMDSDFVMRNESRHRKKLVINKIKKCHDNRAREVSVAVTEQSTSNISRQELDERQRRTELASEFQRQKDEERRRRRAAGAAGG